MSGAQLYFQTEFEGLRHLLRRVDVAEPKLMGPALAEELIGETALLVLVLRVLLEIDDLDEVLAVPEPLDAELAAALEDPPAALGELGVAHLAGHLLARAQGGQVERADEGVRAFEVDVVGVVLAVLDQAVVVAVLGDREFQGLLDPGPVSLQERIVRRAQMLAIGLEDGAALAVGGIGPIAAEADEPRSVSKPSPKSCISRALRSSSGNSRAAAWS